MITWTLGAYLCGLVSTPFGLKRVHHVSIYFCMFHFPIYGMSADLACGLTCIHGHATDLGMSTGLMEDRWLGSKRVGDERHYESASERG